MCVGRIDKINWLTPRTTRMSVITADALLLLTLSTKILCMLRGRDEIIVSTSCLHLMTLTSSCKHTTNRYARYGKLATFFLLFVFVSTQIGGENVDSNGNVGGLSDRRLKR